MPVELLNKISTNKLLSLKDKEEWSAYLNRLPGSVQSVYYTPEYYKIYENLDHSEAFCYVFEDGNHLAVYPFLLSRINDLGYKLDEYYYDIQGAYGYNGVLYSSDEPDFIKSFHCEFNNFCRNNNIVAEFTRFYPLINNQEFSKNYMDVSCNRKVVIINLTQEYQDIYRNYPHSTKGNLKKALRNNLKVFIYKNDFPYDKDFKRMYKETMARVNAQPYLFFNGDYFENTFKTLPIIQFVVFNDGLPISSSLCLVGSRNLDIHFEASKGEYLHLRPNDILIDTMIRWGITKGYKTMNFGGGTSSNEDDSLFRFKYKFSKDIRNFYIGKKIHNYEVYNNICEQWGSTYPHLVDKYKNILLMYRHIY